MGCQPNRTVTLCMCVGQEGARNMMTPRGHTMAKAPGRGRGLLKTQKRLLELA